MVLIEKGKIRTLYPLEDGKNLLLWTSDKISAFDKVLDMEMPGKGKILTQISKFWFERTRDICPNHLLQAQDEGKLDEICSLLGNLDSENCMIVRRLQMFPVEVIVRAHMYGSLWKQYQNGDLADYGPCSKGDKLESLVITPTTKAAIGEKDENISMEEMKRLCGGEKYYSKILEYSKKLFLYAYEYLSRRGILLIDSKMEFGVDENGIVYVADELFTPDNSRFARKDGEIFYHYDKEWLRQELKAGHNEDDRCISELAKRYREIAKIILS